MIDNFFAVRDPPCSSSKTVQQLTPRAHRLYKRGRNFQSVISVYKKRTASLRKRLSMACRLSIKLHHNKMALRPEAVNFCIQQLSRRQTKSSKGYRFTQEEKLLSLALYKTSGASYRFLAKWFKLPSLRTLSKMLYNVNLDEGISDLIIENLKESVRSLKQHEKLCILMFDEMALMPAVSFNKRADSLIGVDDEGNIADHALVFMIRGVTRKWKQTVAYSFCKSTTKPAQLKSMIKSLVRKLRDAGG